MCNIVHTCIKKYTVAVQPGCTSKFRQLVYSFFWLTIQRYNLQIYRKYSDTSATHPQLAFWYIVSWCPFAVIPQMSAYAKLRSRAPRHL